MPVSDKDFDDLVQVAKELSQSLLLLNKKYNALTKINNDLFTLVLDLQKQVDILKTVDHTDDCAACNRKLGKFGLCEYCDDLIQ